MRPPDSICAAEGGLCTLPRQHDGPCNTDASEMLMLHMDRSDWRDVERCAAGNLDYAEPHDDWCLHQQECRELLRHRTRMKVIR